MGYPAGHSFNHRCNPEFLKHLLEQSNVNGLTVSEYVNQIVVGIRPPLRQFRALWSWKRLPPGRKLGQVDVKPRRKRKRSKKK